MPFSPSPTRVCLPGGMQGCSLGPHAVLLRAPAFQAQQQTHFCSFVSPSWGHWFKPPAFSPQLPNEGPSAKSQGGFLLVWLVCELINSSIWRCFPASGPVYNVWQVLGTLPFSLSPWGGHRAVGKLSCGTLLLHPCCPGGHQARC